MRTVRKHARVPRVFVVLGSGPIFTVGDASYIGKLITLAGGENAARLNVAYGAYSAEALLAVQPDVLVADPDGTVAIRARSAPVERAARRPRAPYCLPSGPGDPRATRSPLQRRTRMADRDPQHYARLSAVAPRPQRALLVAVDLGDRDAPLAPEFAEFAALARATGRRDRRRDDPETAARRSGDAGRQRQGARDRGARQRTRRPTC